MRIAVVGAHLSGQPLNHQLTSRGATLVGDDDDGAGLPAVRAGDRSAEAGPGARRRRSTAPARSRSRCGSSTPPAFGSFVDEIPAPLGIGRVLLADGTDVAGFLCEPIALDGAPDITRVRRLAGVPSERRQADEHVVAPGRARSA